MKGLAHIGAWLAIEEAHVPTAGIVGTSIGALVAVCVASGMGWHELAPLAFDFKKDDIVRIDRRVAWVNGIRLESVFKGETLREYVERIVPADDWDALRFPVLMNAVNLETGENEWFGPGARTDASIVDAVYASCALPVLYPPGRIDGGFFVDGGVGDALAIAKTRDVGATGVIAVDVGSGPRSRSQATVEEGMISIHQRVFSIMAGRRRRESIATWDGAPLLLVRPRLEGYDTFGFEHVKYFLEEGYRATRAALVEGGPLLGRGAAGVVSSASRGEEGSERAV